MPDLRYVNYGIYKNGVLHNASVQTVELLYEIGRSVKIVNRKLRDILWSI